MVKRQHPEKPTDAEIAEARAICKRVKLDNSEVDGFCGSCHLADGSDRVVGVRQAYDKLLKKPTLTFEEQFLAWAVVTLIEDIDYYYRYEKDYSC